MIKTLYISVLSLLGIASVFMGGSVIFDLFGIREMEGNYVPFIVWANFICGFLYLLAVYAILNKKSWQKIPLMIAFTVLMMAFSGLIIHIQNEGAYEHKTVKAMIFRTILTLIFLLTHKKIFKMKKFMIPAIIGIAMLTSCDKKQTDAVDHSEHTAQTENAATENHDDHADHADTNVGLVLDNGNKWKTNTEMLPFIQEQERLLDAYDDNKDDYKVLAANLNSANEKLIKSCTMTGKSHDVLHVWLTDHMRNIDLLAKATTKEEADKVTDALEHSMETYHQYFD